MYKQNNIIFYQLLVRSICLCLLSSIVVSSSACYFTSAVRKGDAPEDYYDEGLENMKRKLWQDAENAFNQIRTKFSYSKYATLAELKLADIKFKSEKYPEAIDAYHLFAQSHPYHEAAPYAVYMEALSHYKEMAEEYFFLPPAHEKDETEVKKAMKSFQDYLSRYPNDTHTPEARQYYEKCLKRLVAHDLYVGRFYLKNKRYPGAIARFENVRTQYGEYQADPIILLALATAYEGNKQPEKAVLLYQIIVNDAPKSKEAAKASQRLKKLPILPQQPSTQPYSQPTAEPSSLSTP